MFYPIERNLDQDMLSTMVALISMVLEYTMVGSKYF